MFHSPIGYTEYPACHFKIQITKNMGLPLLAEYNRNKWWLYKNHITPQGHIGIRTTCQGPGEEPKNENSLQFFYSFIVNKKRWISKQKRPLVTYQLLVVYQLIPIECWTAIVWVGMLMDWFINFIQRNSNVHICVWAVDSWRRFTHPWGI